MTGYVYILKSKKDNRTYTGSTDNIERRLSQHQKGQVTSTKNRLPVELIYSEQFSSLEEARKKEKYYKSCSGRKVLKNIFKNLPLW